MKVHNYNARTGEYIDTKEARESPLEPGVYLIPANSTTVAPPTVGDSEVAVFVDGSWEVKPDFRGTWYNGRDEVEVTDIGPLPDGYTAEPAPLTDEEVMAEKLKEIAANRYTIETSPMVHDGVTWYMDREARTTLDLTIDKIRRGVISEMPFKCVDGWYTLTAGNVDAVEEAAVQHVAEAFAWERAEQEKLL